MTQNDSPNKVVLDAASWLYYTLCDATVKYDSKFNLKEAKNNIDVIRKTLAAPIGSGVVEVEYIDLMKGKAGACWSGGVEEDYETLGHNKILHYIMKEYPHGIRIVNNDTE